MQLEVFSDVVCPWCWIGKRRLARALAAFPHRDRVEVVRRSFLLDPDATSVGRPAVERLAERYGIPVAQAAQMDARVSAVAAQDGLDYHLDRAIEASTLDAHRVLHLATARGRGEVLHERVFAAYVSHGVDLGDRAELVRLAVEAGLDRAEVEQALADGAYAEQVRADFARARAYGISGVPFVVLDGRLGVSGAQPVDVFAEALAQAWARAHPIETVVGGAAGSCDDAGCVI